MRSALSFALFCLTLLPAQAQDRPSPEGFSLFEEGARLMLRGLMDEMEPALDDMGKALDEAGPALRGLMAMIGDLRNYHAPEKQPNGDILIRRKSPLELLLPGDGPEIEL